MSNHEVYTKITARIVAAIEKGIVPWTRPYVGAGLPRNASSGRRYSGINVWVTLTEALAHDYSSCGWLTFKQAISLGLVVRKGQHATPVLFMSKVAPKAAAEDARPWFMAKSYSVFNLDQLAELEPGSGAAARVRAETDVEFTHDAVASCEALIAATGAVVKHVRGNALMPAAPAYVPGLDLIEMPYRNKFVSRERYYATLFHELVHWTGHRSRLNRDITTRFGSNAYAAEELVAELGAAMLAYRHGMDVVSYSAQYLSTWLTAMHEHPNFLVACASAASSAVDLLMPSDHEDASQEVAA